MVSVVYLFFVLTENRQAFTVHADFSCSLYFGIVPEYIDYYVKGISSGTGEFTPVLLGRREFHQSLNTPPIDTFSATVCILV